jgi:glyoxylase-like metal-dependent hydrolase (beta-lactamase superfamily II)/ferredoxin
VARLSERLAENAAGEFFVDRSCIDCDTCRQVAPATFARADAVDQSIVEAQPHDDAERERALMALVACPTSSIGTVHKLRVRQAARRFPEPIGEGVYYCGFASPDSYGASSYLIVRPQGNVLVDSPRATPVLFERLRALGGVKLQFLTHRDDVADHARFHEQLGCERILHRADVTTGTRAVERLLDGDAPIAIDDDLTVIPVPGHTRGSAALLWRNQLFTGDHLWADEAGRLSAGRDVCWYSWPTQTHSMEKLLEVDFIHVLPGHLRRFGAPSPQAMREELRRLIRWMHNVR